MGILVWYLTKYITLENKMFYYFSFVIGFLLYFATMFPEMRLIFRERVIYWGIPSFFLVLSMVGIHQFVNKFFILLGDASYSIYLVQVLSIPFYYKIISKFSIGLPGDLHALIALISTGLVGLIVYWFIEQPLSKIVQSIFPIRQL